MELNSTENVQQGEKRRSEDEGGVSASKKLVQNVDGNNHAFIFMLE